MLAAAIVVAVGFFAVGVAVDRSGSTVAHRHRLVPHFGLPPLETVDFLAVLG
jgi:hypothetical protein